MLKKVPKKALFREWNLSRTLGSFYHYHSLRKWAAGGAGGCGGGGEGITLNLHKITPDIKSCAMFERLFEKKSDLQSID